MTRLIPPNAGNERWPCRLYSVAPYGNLTGAPVSSLNHARLMREHFESVCLVLPQDGEIRGRAEAEDVPVLLLPIENRGFRARIFRRGIWADLAAVLGSRWGYYRRLCRELKRAPGVVHVHSRASIAPLALLAARRCGMPSVLHFRERAFPGWKARLWTRLLCFWASAVVFVSEAIRRGYAAGIQRRSRVIHNFMELPPPDPAKGNPVPVVATVAWWSRAKGYDLFLEACRLLRDRGNSFEAWMIGQWHSEEDRQWAERFIQTHHLGSTVKIRGLLADMAEAYAQMDVLLLPTRRDSFPRVVMEAMGHGLPVVATRIDGVPEMVEEGATGFMVEPEDAAGFAAAAERLLRDPVLRRTMGAAGWARARTLFSPETYAARIRDLYREIGGAR